MIRHKYFTGDHHLSEIVVKQKLMCNISSKKAVLGFNYNYTCYS